jgi:hypothetical protein
MLRQTPNRMVFEAELETSLTLHKHTPLLKKMGKGKGTKQLQTTASKLKASQKSQARGSGGRPQKGIQRQKRLASDGSDDADSSEENTGPSRPRKKSRHVGIRGKEIEEEVEEEKDDDDIEQVDNDDDDGKSEDVGQVSSYNSIPERKTYLLHCRPVILRLDTGARYQTRWS